MAGAKSDRPPNRMTQRSAFLAMLIASPILMLFTYLGEFDQGIGAWICAGFIVLTVKAHWDLRKHLWFWAAILLATALQVPFVMFVPWTRRYWSMMVLLPFALLDYVVIKWCIKLAENVAKRRLPPYVPM